MDPVEQRIPCTDEMCTGILDASGECGTCGRTGDVSLVERAANEDASGPDAAEAGDLAAQETETESAPPMTESVSESAIDPEERVPCVDDMCIGIIGADGRCGTCGK